MAVADSLAQMVGYVNLDLSDKENISILLQSAKNRIETLTSLVTTIENLLRKSANL